MQEVKNSKATDEDVLANHPVLFYDGVCGLCDRSVQFVLRHDKRRQFRFATLQSDLAFQTLGAGHSYDSLILYEQGKITYRSTAALRILKILGGGWSILYALMIVPPFIRNGVYDMVARNRYKWFGKLDACRIPTSEEKAQFLS